MTAACLMVYTGSYAQSVVADKSMRYQEERMVATQWDQNKFTPTSGFLGLNPYYWLTWGFFYPNYHKIKMRPDRIFQPFQKCHYARFVNAVALKIFECFAVGGRDGGCVNTLRKYCRHFQ